MSRGSGTRFAVWVRNQANRFRGSLFGRPALYVVAAAVGATAITEFDRSLGDVSLPVRLTSTVDSARALLGAVTSGTIAAASVVFSLTLVAIQLSSTSYSSRVVRTFLRDRFQQNVIGLVMGTFAYAMLVLRSVRGPLEEGGTPFVPTFSVLVATLLALASLLALIASINHTAQNLRVSTITNRLVADITKAVADCLPYDENKGPEPATIAGASRTTADKDLAHPHEVDPMSPDIPSGPGTVLTAAKSGWVQQISLPAIRSGLPQAATVRIDVAPGAYVFAGAPLLTVWPQPALADIGETQENLRRAFALGAERSLQQDLTFGFVLLEDIAVRALSPGVNDPNTAREVIPQLGEILLDVLGRPLPPNVSDADDCQILQPWEATYEDYVRAAFAQTRRYALGETEVMASLITTTRTVQSELLRRGESNAAARAALQTLVEGLSTDVAAADLSAKDREQLESLLATLRT